MGVIEFVSCSAVRQWTCEYLPKVCKMPHPCSLPDTVNIICVLIWDYMHAQYVIHPSLMHVSRSDSFRAKDRSAVNIRCICRWVDEDMIKRITCIKYIYISQ